MKFNPRPRTKSSSIRLTCAFLAILAFAGRASAETICAATIYRDLIFFDSADPSNILLTVPITGLTGQNDFEAIRRMDVRPSNGKLYAVGNAPGGIYRLYTIDPATGVATQIGGNLPGIPNSFGFNFDPVRDEIRIVTGENLRFNPDTAALIATETAMHYNDAGPPPLIVASTFNEQGAGLHVDRQTTELVAAQNQDSGLLARGINLGVTLPNYIDGVNLERSSAGDVYLVLSDPNEFKSRLYTVTFGGASLVGEIGPGTVINAIALVPLPGPPPALPHISFISMTPPYLPGGRIRFAAGTDPGLNVRIQATTTPGDEGSWTDLPTFHNGQMSSGRMIENDPSNPGAGIYTLATAEYPHHPAIYFRAISAKPGFVDGKSDVIGPFDTTVPEPPAHGGLSQTIFKVNESFTPPPVCFGCPDISDTIFRFAAVQTGTAKGLAVRVQANTTDPNNEGAWSDLANDHGGRMARDVAGHVFFLHSTDYPLQSGVYFRAVTSAPGYSDSISNVVGPFQTTTGSQHFPPMTLVALGNSHVADMLFLAHAPLKSLASEVATLRVQSSTTPSEEGSWTDLNPSEMAITLNQDTFADLLYSLVVNNLPAGVGVYFRAISPRSHYAEIVTNVCGPFSIVADVPPVVTIQPKPVGLPGSGDGHDANNPILIPLAQFHFGATAASNRPIKTLKLKFDGATVAEFSGATGATDYTPPTIGDHVLEAVAIDDLNAKARDGTAPLYIRVVPDGGSNAHKPGGGQPLSPSVAQAAGKTFTVVTDNGEWYNANTWRDRSNQPGIPGPADVAVIGTRTVKFSATENVGNVKALSINGGRITGPGTLNVSAGGQLSVGEAGATFDGMSIFIRENAAAALLNASNITFNGGEIFNFGTINLQGSGGIAGTNEIVNYGKVNWLTPIKSPPNPQSPTAVVRPVPVTTNKGTYSTDYAVKLIGQDGASLIGQDGASLISDKGGGIIGDAGAGLIGQDGASLISDGGAGLIGQDGASVLTHNGGGLIGVGVGSYLPRLNHESLPSRRPAHPTADFTYTQDAGETNLDGITILGSVVINGGSLTGSGVITGNVTNKSFIVPGHSAGTIQIGGNFTQESQGSLVMENGGTKPNQYDQIQVRGTANLAGSLQLRNINGYVSNPADTFSPLGFASATGSLSTGANTQITVKGNGLLTTVDPNVPGPSTGQPLNIATRLQIQSGENVLIAGFIITGPAGSTKQVLIRGLGPSLASLGVPGTIPDPLLELNQPGGGKVTNDNWQQASNAGQIPNGFAPSSAVESAIYVNLAPGAYTAILKGAHGEAGVGLVEVYDFESSSGAKLANIATRGFVNTGDAVMIGGFIIGGTQPASVLVRAIGPSLVPFGIQGALLDTTLELHDSNGTGVTYNDDWRSTQEMQIKGTTIPPSDDRESAIVATLVPGPYTAVVRGANGTTGIAVIEAYNLQ